MTTTALLFIGALALLILAVLVWTQSDDAGFNKAKNALSSLDGDLKALTGSLDKFRETCENLTAKLDSVKTEVQELKDKQAKIDERLIASKVDQHVTLETRPLTLKPIQVELITRSGPLLDRAGVTGGPPPVPGKVRPGTKKSTKGERRAVN